MVSKQWLGVPVILRVIKKEREEWLKDGKDGEYDTALAISALTQLEWRIKDEAKKNGK